MDGDSAVGLAGQFAGLDDQLAAGELDLLADHRPVGHAGEHAHLAGAGSAVSARHGGRLRCVAARGGRAAVSAAAPAGAAARSPGSSLSLGCRGVAAIGSGGRAGSGLCRAVGRVVGRALVRSVGCGAGFCSHLFGFSMARFTCGPSGGTAAPVC